LGRGSESRRPSLSAPAWCSGDSPSVPGSCSRRPASLWPGPSGRAAGVARGSPTVSGLDCGRTRHHPPLRPTLPCRLIAAGSPDRSDGPHARRATLRRSQGLSALRLADERPADTPAGLVFDFEKYWRATIVQEHVDVRRSRQRPAPSSRACRWVATIDQISRRAARSHTTFAWWAAPTGPETARSGPSTLAARATIKMEAIAHDASHIAIRAWACMAPGPRGWGP
jgi:hypothetical protein